ncbi:hypothetical protein CSB45_12350 [candidate division KSB3 bacterium]|uniref:Uncharacterized protein n=1 Tax=candidate division KSB3 bacterium TaxID=2044937 RepID=A0A2G6E250_9BACT|nr:MAG: hypothetical protein CSB45_12350 [candidate division KSB3 bacterium]PIE28687.1 MAG: hypothetical protein CSA57_12330 [candidate division KSB3 bacterium]
MKTRIQHYQRELIVLAVLGGALLLTALTLNYRLALEYLFSDESVYYMMAQSLAFDQDLEYTREDLIRFYEDGWKAGPLGIFLSKLNGKIFYSKAFMYSWVLSPFIRLFGVNGFLLLNALILFGLIVLGWVYLRQFNASWPALLLSLAFFLLSSSAIYLFWLTPEVFSMGCVASGLFLWLYHVDHRSSAVSSRSGLTAALMWILLSPEGRLYLAPIPIAMATMAKPPNVLFFVPILADLFFAGRDEQAQEKIGIPMSSRWISRARRLAIVCLIFLLVVGMFYTLQYRYTGSINPYGGDRRSFYRQFPQDASDPVWDQGVRLSTGDYWEKSWFFHPRTLLLNIYYYLFGRFTGLLPYFFCTFLALYYFLRHMMRWTQRCSRREKHMRLQRLFLLSAILGSIGTYIVLMPINYHGGGGAFGNRYFINIYPAFLFLITAMSSLRPLLISSLIGLSFLAQTFVNPFRTSYTPAVHAFHGIHRLLPVELTLIDTLPNLINSRLMQTAVLEDGSTSHRIYFFDDNVYNPGANAFWVKGGGKAEMAIRSFRNQQSVLIRITNGLAPNVVEVSTPLHSETFVLNAPGESQELVWPLEEYAPYFDSAVFPLTVHSQKGAIPLFTPGADTHDATFLGCQVTLSFDAFEIGEACLEAGDYAKAIDTLSSLVQRDPENLQARYALGRAYHHAGFFEDAIANFDMIEKALPDFQERFWADLRTQHTDALPRLQPLYGSRDDFPADLTLHYDADDFRHNTGSSLADPDALNGRAFGFIPEKHLPGFLTYGPYVSLPAGEYLVKFRIKIGEQDISPGKQPCPAFTLDVYQGGRRVIAAKTIALLSEQQAAPGTYRDYILSFTNQEAAPLEFRVNVSGSVPVSFDQLTLIPMLPLRLYEALGESQLRRGDLKAARHYLHQAAAQAGDAESVETAFKALIEMRQWEAVEALLQNYDVFSAMRSGPLTPLFHLSHGMEEDMPETLRSSLASINAFFSPEQHVDANFQDLIAFRGLTVYPTETAPGDSFTIVYFWEALRDMDVDYTFFVHIIKEGSRSALWWTIQRVLGIPVSHVFQHDHTPLHGDVPTRLWKAGELLREEYEVDVPADLAEGRYEIWLGIYDERSGKKLQSAQRTTIKIGELHVRSPAE